MNDAPMTVREVYALVDRINLKIEAQFDKHAGEHKAHDVEHEREQDRRAGLIRWAVTSCLAAGGTLVAIWLGVRY